jgi:hypothetical protein
MKGSRYSFEVERYVVLARSEGRRLELDGWIMAEPPVDAVRLAPPGAAPYPVSLYAQADDDDHRLLLHLRADAPDDEFSLLDEAWLEIDAANGDRLEFGIGHLFRHPAWMPPVIAFQTGPADACASVGAEVPDATAMAFALRDGFEAIHDDQDLYLHRSGNGWTATSHRYGIRFAVVPERTEAREAARSTVSAILDALADGAPLLLHHRTPADTDDGAADLFAALRARNPCATLLWVDPWRDPGPVVRFRPNADRPVQSGLLVGSAQDDRDIMILSARDLLVSGG